MTTEFRNQFGATTFYNKYAQGPSDTWAALAERLVEDVCGSRWGTEEPLLSEDERRELVEDIKSFRFVPGGRYLYYAGRESHAYFNCFLAIPQNDDREQWSEIMQWATSSLMQGGGIGIDYSVFRPRDTPLGRTGGSASGPISLMKMINEAGRYVMQGGSRRSAIYASLNWQHADADEFLKVKNWHEMDIAPDVTAWDAKQHDFNFAAPLDMTNISLNYDNHFLARIRRGEMPTTFLENVRQAMSTGEPGMSFNTGSKVDETGRNACTEVTTSSPFDSCNLGSVNLSRIGSIEQLREVSERASKFLYCGTERGTIDHGDTRFYQLQNRRLGLGLMGVHEWLLQRHYHYNMNDELHNWLRVWREASFKANQLADKIGSPRPVAYRAIAPTGSIGILAGTTTGIEPLYSVAYKRRYLKGTHDWHYQYVVDSAADELIRLYDLDPEKIESSIDLASDPERRIKFQADVQDYVDMAISSTINLPAWGSENNNESHVEDFAHTLAGYAHRLRGFTVYPDGARGGQPLESVPYAEAREQMNTEFKENNVCDITKGGVCGE